MDTTAVVRGLTHESRFEGRHFALRTPSHTRMFTLQLIHTHWAFHSLAMSPLAPPNLDGCG